MDPYQWWWHGFGFMWMFPFFFLIGMVLCVVFFARGGWFGRTRHDRREPRETGRDILDRRFARGEITREEYQRMRKDLE
ncbi:MAG: SHOCT domain-containing protein [Betaproteobacteria bacterium]